MYRRGKKRTANGGRCGYVQILPHLTKQWNSKTSQRRKHAWTKSNRGSVHSTAAATLAPYKKFSSRYANRTLLP